MKSSTVTIPDGPFGPNWESLKRYSVPRWYMDLKFGIYFHWGVYSVPAFENEWYPRNMYLRGQPAFEHHLKTYGLHKQFGYKDFVSMFKAEKWNPAEWVELFKKSGAKYVVEVAEHHDGFAMYDCSYTKWNAVKMGPKRDVVGEMAAEVRKKGMVFGISFHRAEHWWFFEGGMQFDSDVRDPEYRDFYGPAEPRNTQPNREFLEDWLNRACELVDKYRPQIFWFDWWIEQPAFEPYLQRFAAYYYNRAAQWTCFSEPWSNGVVINYKHNAFPQGAAVLNLERGRQAALRSMFWQTDTSICKKSWGYILNHDYKSAGSIIVDLVDIVSKNGCLLLNVAPRSDGTIPEEQQQILLEIGKWLEVNGEAIFGTRPWKVYGEGPTQVKGGEFTDNESVAFTSRDLRFTTKGEVLYAIALAVPEKELVIKSLSTDLRLYGGKVEGVQLLGSEEPVDWSRSDRGLIVKMPAEISCRYAVAVKIVGKP